MAANFVSFRAGEIHFTEKGKGNAIILLHGFLESKEMWKHYVSALSASFRLITIDLPGHGASSNYGYIHTMEFMAEAIHAVMKQLGIRKAIFVGHSMGGYVALAFGEKYPDSIKKLCMFHSSAQSDTKARKASRDQMIELVKKDARKVVQALIPSLFNRERKKYVYPIRRLLKVAEQQSPQGIVAAIAGMKARLEREIILQFAPYPVLYILGKKDPILDWEKVSKEAELAQNGECLLLENVGHMGMYEDKATCLAAILKFARKPIKRN